MGIRSLFAETWEVAREKAQHQKNSEILEEHRTIIINHNLRKWVWGQLIMRYNKQGEAELITRRFCVPPLALSAYFNHLIDFVALRKYGIECHVVCEPGVVTCNYTKTGWLKKLIKMSKEACANE